MSTTLPAGEGCILECTEAWDNTVRLEQSANWVGWMDLEKA